MEATHLNWFGCACASGHSARSTSRWTSPALHRPRRCGIGHQRLSPTSRCAARRLDSLRDLMNEPKPDRRRKYPRIKVPKGMFVGWKSPAHHTVSRMQELGLGGVFVYTTEPETKGSTIEILFDVPTGEVRARAIVRHVRPGVGMGLQFIQMRPEDRARLHRFLIAEVEAPDASPDKKSARPAAQPPSPTPDST